jgi:hypothetical protein
MFVLTETNSLSSWNGSCGFVSVVTDSGLKESEGIVTRLEVIK